MNAHQMLLCLIVFALVVQGDQMVGQLAIKHFILGIQNQED